ncbi:hypothetical protein NDU88_001672 [Pleurodeles waltl]|uniref:Uncharacterized protein n=1 Tax=Pleurodeles waltl TaxID=8319 RepID=A0AAV7P8N2_PLEWA|nr:hypothetical protein NDU88_001672 [Pleurodeles waltl]
MRESSSPGPPIAAHPDCIARGTGRASRLHGWGRQEPRFWGANPPEKWSMASEDRANSTPPDSKMADALQRVDIH